MIFGNNFNVNFFLIGFLRPKIQSYRLVGGLITIKSESVSKLFSYSLFLF